MRSFILLCLLGFAAFIHGTGQPLFEKIVAVPGDQAGSGVAVVPGGYAVCGHTAVPGSLVTDAWILLFDEDGDTLWTRTFGGPGIDDTRSILWTADSSLVACGTWTRPAPGGPGLFLLKITLEGDTVWTRKDLCACQAYGYSVSTAGTGFILCGYADQGRSTPRMLLVRTNDLGDTLWTRQFGDTLSSAGLCAMQTPDGGFVACGYADSFTGGWDRNIYLVRTDGQGDTIWTRTFIRDGYEVAWSVVSLQEGGFILTGYHDPPGNPEAELFLMRVSDDGELLWQKFYGHSGLDIGFSVVTATGGGYVAAGQGNEAGEEYQSMYLVRTDADGDTLWTRELGDYPRNSGSCIRETSDGGWIIAGETNSLDPDELYDVYLVRTDPNGIITASDPGPAVPGVFACRPNPAGETLTVQAGEPVTRVEVYDPQGRLRLSEVPAGTDNRSLVIRIPSSLKGFCLVRVTTLHRQFTQPVLIR